MKFLLTGSTALILFISCIFPGSAHAAQLYLDPDQGKYGPGDTFILNVRLDTEDECINAADVLITYPSKTLRAVDFGRGRSILSLWVTEPVLDVEKGTVRFVGGIPGGYCGRVPGDPSLSNILGKVVFTVIAADQDKANINFSSESQVYLSDGLGTKADTKSRGATIALQKTAVGTPDPWLLEVGEDDIPPDPFAVEVQSTRGVYGGKYYIVFSTIDKQSGMDHFELFERGGWITIESPYQLRNQFILDDIQVRAIDKAGNERVGTYEKGSVPIRQFSFSDYLLLIAVVIIVLLLGGGVYFWQKRDALGKRQ